MGSSRCHRVDGLEHLIKFNAGLWIMAGPAMIFQELDYRGHILLIGSMRIWILRGFEFEHRVFFNVVPRSGESQLAVKSQHVPTLQHWWQSVAMRRAASCDVVVVVVVETAVVARKKVWGCFLWRIRSFWDRAKSKNPKQRCEYGVPLGDEGFLLAFYGMMTKLSKISRNLLIFF